MLKRIAMASLALIVMVSAMVAIPASKASAWTNWYDHFQDLWTVSTVNQGSVTCLYNGDNLGIEPNGHYSSWLFFEHCTNSSGYEAMTVSLRHAAQLKKTGLSDATTYPDVLYYGSMDSQTSNWAGYATAYGGGEVGTLVAVCDDIANSCTYPRGYNMYGTGRYL